MKVKDLERNDVVRVHHRSGPVIGVVARTYESGGKSGASYTGVFVNDGSQIQAHVKEGMKIELLWREDKNQK